MSPADKAKRTVIGIEIPRDELALRIAMPCTQMRPIGPVNATEALDAMNSLGITPGMSKAMGDTFRDAADAAVRYFHECVNAGRQPS